MAFTSANVERAGEIELGVLPRRHDAALVATQHAVTPNLPLRRPTRTNARRSFRLIR
jgi:hypothetical protein